MKTPSTGFTLLELVVVILLMGILAFELVPRLSGTSAYDARGYFDQAANGLRYAQRLATASGCDVSFALSSGSPPSFSLNQPGAANCSGSQPVLRPAGSGPYVVSAGNGVTVSSNVTVTFTADSTATVAGMPLTISGGGFSGTINVIPGTAFVQTSP